MPIDSTHQGSIIVKVQDTNEPKSLVLRLANLQQKPVQIMIFNDLGEVQYSEKVVEHNGYRKLLNLQKLKSGDYKLVILHPFESIKGTLHLSFNETKVVWE